MRLVAALVLTVAAARPAAAAGACCGGAATPAGGERGIYAAALVTDARSTEEFGSRGAYVFDQTGVTAKIGFPVWRQLAGAVLGGGVFRSRLRGGGEERLGGPGFLYGLQLSAPVWRDEERRFGVTAAGSWSRSSAALDRKRTAAGETPVDQTVHIEEFQANMVATKRFAPLDLSVGARWFNGHTEVSDEAGVDSLTGHRDGHAAGLVGARIHLGSESRSLFLEYGFGSVRTLSAGLAFSF